MSFGILIPTRSALGALKITLDALIKNSRLENEIIVIGTKPHLRIKEYMKSVKEFHEKNNIKYYEIDRHNCFAAYNYGADLTSKNYLLFLQDDMYLTPDWDINISKYVSEDRIVYFLFSCPPDIGVERIYGDKVEFCDCGGLPIIRQDGTLMGTFDESKYIKFFNQIKVKQDNIDHNWAPSLIPYIMSKNTFVKFGKYRTDIFQHLSAEESNFVGRIAEKNAIGEKNAIEIIRCLNAGVYHFRSVTVLQVKEDKELLDD